MTAKRTVAVLILILLLPILSGSAIKLPEIKDIQGHWAADYIIECTERGICEGFGDGFFKPDRPVTRAEFTKMVVIAFNINNPEDSTETSSESAPEPGSNSYSQPKSDSSTQSKSDTVSNIDPRLEANPDSKTNSDSNPKTTVPAFEDVTDHWAKPYIEAAYSARLILGVDELHFMPDKALSRQDAVLILSRIEKHLGRQLPEIVQKSGFLDAEYIREDCREAITHFQKCGIISGKTGNLFDPIGSMTRAETSECIILTIFAFETPA